MLPSKLNDPLRWLLSPLCLIVSVVLVAPIIVMLRSGQAGASLLLFIALGVPSALLFCTSLIVSRINVLIETVEENRKNEFIPEAVKYHGKSAISETGDRTEADEPVCAAPSSLYKRSKLGR